MVVFGELRLWYLSDLDGLMLCSRLPEVGELQGHLARCVRTHDTTDVPTAFARTKCRRKKSQRREDWILAKTDMGIAQVSNGVSGMNEWVPADMDADAIVLGPCCSQRRRCRIGVDDAETLRLVDRAVILQPGPVQISLGPRPSSYPSA